MVHLDILKELQKRRRRKVEINKSMHDNIKYHADMRASTDREINRAEAPDTRLAPQARLLQPHATPASL